MDGIYRQGWFVQDYAQYDFTLDESEPMGDQVRLVLQERLFDLPEGKNISATVMLMPRWLWDELMRARAQHHPV